MTTIHGKSYGTGRRKNAVARVFLKPGTGVITVNDRPIERYFTRQTSQMVVRQALELVEKNSELDVAVNVCGQCDGNSKRNEGEWRNRDGGTSLTRGTDTRQNARNDGQGLSSAGEAEGSSDPC